ncbi:MAG: glycosyltransferase family 4 protein [Deltaproteobacteria bacterium]|nr:glycosyltransferase family 4 protein [Deltaproteobacteria bacterium]
MIASGHERGGILHFTASLASELLRVGRRPVQLFAPLSVLEKMRVKLPEGVFREYRPVAGSWGRNQWKFVLESTLRFGWARWMGRMIVHLNHPSLIAPHVYVAHGIYSRNWLRHPKSALASRALFRLMSAVENHMLRGAERVVFVSSDDREYVETRLGIRRPDAFVVVNPGVDATLYAPVARDAGEETRRRDFPEVNAAARWLLFAGNDFDGKGLLRLFEALGAHLGDGAPAWQLLVFGRDDANAAEARARAARLGGRVHFFTDDRALRKAFGLCDVFVMDSLSEGFPLVLLEALAGGCVPVVTGFGGTRDAIANGRTGFVVKDAPAIAERALSLSADELARMHDAARSSALAFTWKRTAEKLEAVYASLS